MSLQRLHRRCIASLLALVLACLQLWTAAYACPAPPAVAAAVAAMAGMTGCEQMSSPDGEQPHLCKAHCDRDKQTVNKAPAPDLLPTAVLDALFSRLALWPRRQGLEALPAVIAAHAGPPDGAPPVYLALHVLRH